MNSNDYPVVGSFRNDTNSEMHLYLEMIPEQVTLSPGDEVELLARPSEHLLPIDVERVEDGYHIHAHKEWDPDWHVRYRGKVIKARTPTRLMDHR